MDPTATTAPAPEPVVEPPPVPMLFTCAIWAPTFAVVLWFMLRLYGPRGVVKVDEDEGER